MKTAYISIIRVLLLIIIAGCAPGSNELNNSANAKGIVAGFWQGLWNGIIAPVTFVISLFNRNVYYTMISKLRIFSKNLYISSTSPSPTSTRSPSASAGG